MTKTNTKKTTTVDTLNEGLFNLSITTAANSKKPSPAPANNVTKVVTNTVANNTKQLQSKRNIVQEFEDYFGNVTQLGNWQMLCRDVGLHEVEKLSSVKKCRKVIHNLILKINLY